mgnify:CR=1 FL=1
MKKSYIIIGVIVVLVLLLGFNGCNTYNSMVTLGENVDKSWAQVENQYQRRLDLIPNLVNTVKGYAEHESSTLESVTKARAGLSDAYNSAEQLKNGASPADAQQFENYVAAQDRLKSAFDIYVNAVREAYPDLKANQNFIDLQTQLEGTENRIATERGRYTEAVQEYNVKVKRFPANLWAGMFGFSAKPQFKADAAAATAPKVEF